MNIRQVSKALGIAVDELRYYERIGLIPPIKRTKRGMREYTDDDLRWIDFTKKMSTAGLSKETLIDYVHLCTEGQHTVETRRNLLIEESEQLEKRISEMMTSLDQLQSEIKKYNLTLGSG